MNKDNDNDYCCMTAEDVAAFWCYAVTGHVPTAEQIERAKVRVQGLFEAELIFIVRKDLQNEERERTSPID